MSWTEELQDLMALHNNEEQNIGPDEAAKVARSLLEEEIIPRLEALASEAQNAGIRADVKVGEQLSRGPERCPERAGIALLRSRNGQEAPLPVAELEFEYRREVRYEALHHTKEGRGHSTRFRLTGQPLVNVESALGNLREDVGLEV